MKLMELKKLNDIMQEALIFNIKNIMRLIADKKNLRRIINKNIFTKRIK